MGTGEQMVSEKALAEEEECVAPVASIVLVVSVVYDKRPFRKVELC